MVLSLLDQPPGSRSDSRRRQLHPGGGPRHRHLPDQPVCQRVPARPLPDDHAGQGQGGRDALLRRHRRQQDVAGTHGE